MQGRNFGSIVGLGLIAFGIAISGKNTHFLHNMWSNAAEWVDYLESLHWTLGSVSFSVLDFAGSVFVCINYRHCIRDRVLEKRTVPTTVPTTLECFISCILLQFMGTTLTGLLLGTPPSWILSHTAFNALIAAWWLVFCCPGDLFYSFLCSRNPLSTLAWNALDVLRLVSSGHAVSSWGVDKGLNCQFHANGARIAQSYWTCLFCGLFSGGCGAVVSDWLNYRGDGGDGPDGRSFAARKAPTIFNTEVDKRMNALMAPARALILAAAYLFLISENGAALRKADAKALVIGVVLLQNNWLQSRIPRVKYITESYPHFLSKLAGLFFVPTDISERCSKTKEDFFPTFCKKLS